MKICNERKAELNFKLAPFKLIDDSTYCCKTKQCNELVENNLNVIYSVPLSTTELICDGCDVRNP